jgi:hypothetical protein
MRHSPDSACAGKGALKLRQQRPPRALAAKERKNHKNNLVRTKRVAHAFAAARTASAHKHCARAIQLWRELTLFLRKGALDFMVELSTGLGSAQPASCGPDRRGATKMTKPNSNLEESGGKVVGRVRQRSPADFLERMAARFRALKLELPYPKGVHRFKTFEEADEWETKHRIAAALKRLRGRQT